MLKDGKIIIIGAGISGCVLAERYANVLNKKVLLIEKRNDLGGNCYDIVNNYGILIPKYGPHFFHTDNEEVWKYVNNFSNWYDYEHKVLSYVDSKAVPIPVNIKTVNLIFSLDLKGEEDMQNWLNENIEYYDNPKNSEEASLSRVGRVLYEKMFKNYTKKQWDLWPSELDASVMNRIPVRNNFDDRYFTDKYQYMPQDGYTRMFKNMLNNPNIEIKLNTDFNTIKKDIIEYEKLFYTGRIDHYFDNLFGELQYRSIDFSIEDLDTEYYQDATTVNYPNDYEFTRITEPKHSNLPKYKGIKNKTTIIKEFPSWGSEPFYPVPAEKNQILYKKYKEKAEELEKFNIFMIGRLANYKYLNMDQALANSLELFNKLENSG